MAETDESLFARSVHGDDAALRVLMKRYGDSLTLYLNGYVHDLDTAEDLMIEAFSIMFTRCPLLREGGFKPYLYKTGRNLALRHGHELGRILSLEALELDVQSDENVERGLLANEGERALYRALALIPAPYREALYLVYLEGMSYDEAGAVMRRTRKQVDNLVQRGKSAARLMLEGEGVNLEID
ncbi:MAG: RNA polymerase sigma factor [Atopobiaceae bacterium]|nr:RNA polymerase sigma factor [Atopobiaceae bacterium]MBR1828595.1 RNA polymerase sigma factor [Atopobiaceae bacterium]